MANKTATAWTITLVAKDGSDVVLGPTYALSDAQKWLRGNGFQSTSEIPGEMLWILEGPCIIHLPSRIKPLPFEVDADEELEAIIEELVPLESVTFEESDEDDDYGEEDDEEDEYD